MYRSGAKSPGRILVRYRPYSGSDVFSFLLVGSVSPVLAAALWGWGYRGGAVIASLLSMAVLAAAVRETRAIIVGVDHERGVVLLAPSLGRRREVGLDTVKGAELEVSLRRSGPRAERAKPMAVGRIVLLLRDGTRVAINDRQRPNLSVHEAALERLRDALGLAARERP